MSEKKRVLLSCLGTTDPIRGDYDGPMLHILRYYRPEVVILFYTREIRGFEEQDQRFSLLKACLAKDWKYQPEWIDVDLNETNPSDLSEMGVVLDQAMAPFLKQYASEKLLFNLSSATPQMQFVMSQQVLDTRWDSVGIQVSIPTKKAGKEKRNTDAVDTNELVNDNWDELTAGTEDAVNRCVEPNLFRIRREEDWAKTAELLKQRNFEAVTQLGKTPTGGKAMLKHLYHRNRLELTAARDAAVEQVGGKKKDAPWKAMMYPVAYPAGSKCEELCEYYLIMRNLQRTGRTSEFMVRFNPFMVELLKFYVDRFLQKAPFNSSFAQISQRIYGREIVKPHLLQNVLGGMLFSRVESHFSGGLREGDFSIALGCALLKEVFVPAQDVLDFFDRCEVLNRLRNDTAHKLQVTTEQDIRDQIGIGSRDFCNQIEKYLVQILREAYPQYTETAFDKLFEVYESGIQYIHEHR